ncbi:hypothetical protein B0H13DRAFT_2351978 [Mycena leptocephala]|nr:hypothetical protein B0H13DRAFT_2351978 [Mycena leptocephala]
MSQGRFRLDTTIPIVPSEESASGGNFIFQAFSDPTPRPPPIGSFEHDLKSSKYTLKWDSWREFELLLADEEKTKGIQIRRAKVYDGNSHFDHQYRFNGLANAKLVALTLRLVHQGAYDDDNLFNEDRIAGRNEFIQLQDIRRIEKAIEAETVCLHPDDGQSTLRWVENLRAKDYLLGFKLKSDPPPPSSGLAADVFTLMVRTKWQRKMFAKYGQHILCIDATHNTTVYEKLLLTTLVVRDKHAHDIHRNSCRLDAGIQRYSSNNCLLSSASSPAFSPIPRNFISDFDYPQINACIAEYNAFILRCWWHVLHAWQKHLRIDSYPDLWELLKRRIRITERAEFDTAWDKIKVQAPQGFVEYLTKYWMPEHIIKMWSAVYRKGRTIFEICDTNMLIEAWHHVLKGKFLHGKRNRRMDHLLNTLLNDDLGFEGIDIEVKKRQDIVKKSKEHVPADIEHIESGKYVVRSKSDPSRTYEVDVSTYTCTCLDFPLICFCRHICAVQTLFEEKLSSETSNDEQKSTPSDDGQKSTLANEDLPIPQPLLPPAAPKPRVLTVVAEKLEKLAARLRRPRTKETDLPSLSMFATQLDDMLDATDTGTILPAPQYVKPNVNGWRQTQKAMLVMPAVKTKAKKRVGDPSYGGDESSGSKVKRVKPAEPAITCHSAYPTAAYPSTFASYKHSIRSSWTTASFATNISSKYPSLRTANVLSAHPIHLSISKLSSSILSLPVLPFNGHYYDI